MNLLEMAVELVHKALAGRESMTAPEIANAVVSIHNTLRALQREEEGCTCEKKVKPLPSPGKSVGKNVVICLECGQGFRMLTVRHLLKAHGLTPVEYEVKHGIPETMPLTCIRIRNRKREVALQHDQVGRMHRALGRGKP